MGIGYWFDVKVSLLAITSNRSPVNRPLVRSAWRPPLGNGLFVQIRPTGLHVDCIEWSFGGDLSDCRSQGVSMGEDSSVETGEFLFQTGPGALDGTALRVAGRAVEHLEPRRVVRKKYLHTTLESVPAA